MGSDVSQATYRALVLPHSAIKADNEDTAHGTFTQAGPLPGVPEPQAESELTLQATGTQSAAKQLRVRTQTAGYPGLDGAAFVWRYQGDTLYRGWDEPSVITAWEAVTWIDAGSVADTIKTPDALTLPDEQVLVCYERRIVSGVTAGYYIQVRRRSTAGVWAAAVDVYSQTAIQPDGFHPCLCLLPSGRVLLFHWIDDGSGVRNQVQMRFSDDDGATWALGSKYCLNTPLDTSGSPGAGATGSTPGRLRAAYNGGEILLIAGEKINNTSSTDQDGFNQHASDDLGSSFLHIKTVSGTHYAPEILAMDAGFMVLSLYSLGSATGDAGKVASVKIGSAFTDYTTGSRKESGEYDLMKRASGSTTAGELGVWRDNDGVIWAAIYEDIDLVSCTLVKSTDNGEIWVQVGANADATDPGADASCFWYYQADVGTYPEAWCTTTQAGRALLLHTWVASPGNEDESLGCAYLGGYSSVTMPPFSSTNVFIGLTRASWFRTYLPFDIPSDVGWSGTGSATETIASGYYQINGSASTRRFNYLVPAGSIAEGIIARASFEVVSGGSLALNACAIQLRTADSSDDYQVTVRFSTSAFRVYDDNAGAQVGSDVAIDTTEGVDILVSMSDAKFAIWYRARSTDSDRNWIAGPTSTTLTSDTGSPAAGNLVTFGTLVNHNTTSRWYEFHYVSDEFAGGSLAAGQSNPAELNAKQYSALPVYVDDGVSIAALDGPTYLGDNWNIDTRYTYPTDRIYPLASPSPREKWRSTDETQQQIAWIFDEWIPEGVTLGLYLDGINWRSGTLDWYNGTSWATLITLDAATNRTSLPFTRTGALFHPSATSHTAPYYIERGELQNSTVDFGSADLRRVTDNTAGLWTNATTKKPSVYFAGIDASEAGSGTCNIWSPRLRCVENDVSGPIRGLRLTISAQSTVDGYFTIGTCLIGQMEIFGNDTSWGRSLSIEPNAELTTSRDGARRAQSLGPSRRAVEFAWAEGVDATAIQGLNPSPDYLGLDPSGVPLALRGEPPLLMREIVATLEGSVTPVVYCPNVSGPTSYNDTRRCEALYGRIIGGVSIEQVLGEENISEVFTIASVQIEEEL